MNNTDLAVELFKKTDMIHRRAFESMVKSFNIHRTQHMMLSYIAHTGGAITQKQIADRFEISSSAVAVTIKKLEKNGYIVKTAATGDGRANEIRITEKGNDIIARTHKVFSDIDNDMFKNFSDSELENFIECHLKMQKNLEKYREKTK